MESVRVSNSNNLTELPFGYKFHPTPSEVLQYYLAPRLRGEWLPSGYIKDLDVYQCDPHQIPLNEFKYTRDDEAYFFVPIMREFSQGEGELIRTTPNGYWKVLEWYIPIYVAGGDSIGHKNKLRFYNGNYPNGIITNWKMVEYRINDGANGNVESLMVCKIRVKIEEEEVYEEEVSSGEEIVTNGEENNKIV